MNRRGFLGRFIGAGALALAGVEVAPSLVHEGVDFASPLKGEWTYTLWLRPDGTPYGGVDLESDGRVRGTHYDWIILDDLVDPDGNGNIYDREEQKRAVSEWYHAAVVKEVES